MAFVLQATKSVHAGASREKGTAEGCSLKIPDCFFSRAGMTHYPGSKAGSLVRRVVPQYSDTLIVPARHLQCYSHFGNVTTVMCTHTCTQLHTNA